MTLRTNEELLTPPQVKPAYGAETAAYVLEIIKSFPGLHDQNVFEHDSGGFYFRECGTIRCVAGWAQWVHDGIVDTSDHSDYNWKWVVEVRGAEVLGLDDDDAMHMFYGTDNRQAVRALEMLAAGERINWSETL